MTWIATCDASAQCIDGQRHYVSAWILRDKYGILVDQGVIDHRTNVAQGYTLAAVMTVNVAEYHAVLGVLHYLRNNKLTYRDVTIRTDSKIVVNHINRVWMCNSGHLREIRDQILLLLQDFVTNPVFEWIPREYNREADKLSRSLYPVKLTRRKKHKLIKIVNGIV